MNQRQRAFCEAYLASGNATEAAKAAKYSERTAYAQGQRMLKNVEVQEYLEQRNAEICEENTATIEEVRRFWTSTMRDPAAKQADRLRASELLAKTLGAFVARMELEGAVTSIPADFFASLSDEELRILARLDEGLED